MLEDLYKFTINFQIFSGGCICTTTGTTYSGYISKYVSKFKATTEKDMYRSQS